MPFGAIKLNPGVNTVATPTLNEAGISDSNLIRFRGGLPEKLGGWQKFNSQVMGSITRALCAWQDLSNQSWLGVGNESSLKVISGIGVTDVTPLYLLDNSTVNCSTTVGSSTVTIVDSGISNLTIYDAVYFNTPIAVGGIILAGIYQVTYGSGTTYRIDSGQVATSTVVSGGAVPLFTTTANSATVLVTLANHGLNSNSKFYFPIPTQVAGVTINGVIPSLVVVDTNNFSFVAQSAAAYATTAYMNAGQAQYLYYLTNVTTVVFGAGPQGPIASYPIAAGGGSNTTAATLGAAITATDWTLDNWGEVLLSCPKGGPIFYWRPNSGLTVSAPIGSGPPMNNGIFVSMPQLILVAWGSASSMMSANTNAAIDPLIVRWSDNLDFSEWRATAQTSAGSFHITSGSMIMGGIQAAKAGIIFTDIDVWSMNYIGYPLVFGFEQISAGCGLVGPHAATSIRGAVYWMSENNFCMSTGTGVLPIPCPVWDTVFQNIDADNITKVVAGSNIAFNEVFFFYPSTSGDGENDRYVKLNVVENVWDVGSMSRSAWVGHSVLGMPIGADPDSQYLYQHEMTYNADGSAMNSYYESGYAVIGDGEQYAIVDHFIPDMKYTTADQGSSSATLSVTITAKDFPSGGSETSNLLTMTSTTQYLSPRLRGRQMKWKVESNDLGSWWRQGNPRYRFAPGGRR